jgi:hypothetical protein
VAAGSGGVDAAGPDAGCGQGGGGEGAELGRWVAGREAGGGRRHGGRGRHFMMCASHVEMFRFLRVRRDAVHETFSKFYHKLHMTCDDTS